MAAKDLDKPYPGHIRRARERRGLSPGEVADAMAHLPGAHVVSERTVQKVERGESVDRHRRAALLTFLGLAKPPSLRHPASGQAPGAWLRQLRETHGIGPTDLCRHANYTGSERSMSRGTLAEIEDGRRFPSTKMLDAIVASLTTFSLPIDVVDLEEAWVYHDPDQAAVQWQMSGQQIAEQIRARQRRDPLQRMPGAVAGLRAFAQALERMDLLAPTVAKDPPDGSDA